MPAFKNPQISNTDSAFQPPSAGLGTSRWGKLPVCLAPSQPLSMGLLLWRLGALAFLGQVLVVGVPRTRRCCPPTLTLSPPLHTQGSPGLRLSSVLLACSPYLLDPFSFPPPRSLPQVPQPRGFCVLPVLSGGMWLVCACIDIPSTAHMHAYSLCFYLIFKSLVS